MNNSQEMLSDDKHDNGKRTGTPDGDSEQKRRKVLRTEDFHFDTFAHCLDAALFVAEMHRNQTRKTGGAYDVHPFRVANILAEAGVREIETLVAGMLHDTVEDTEATLAMISARFGALVASIVGEVTDDKDLNKAQRKRAQVEHAKVASVAAVQIKMADAIDNLSGLVNNPPPSWTAERRIGYFVWKKQVTASRHGVCPALEEQLATLFGAVIPEDADEAALLRDYYASMETSVD